MEQETKTEVTATEEPKTTQMSSISDVLQGKEPASEAPTTKQETSPLAQAPVETVPTEEAKATEATQATAPAAPAVDEDNKTNGILKAMQAERKKRQALEAELASLRGTDQGIIEESAQTTSPDFDRKLLTLSENAARRLYSDYDDKFKEFFSAVTDEKSPNHALYQSVMGSDDPGLAAYHAGETLLAIKKYGSDFKSQYSNIRKEVEAELRTSLREEIVKELSGKAAQKTNQPTNILSGRAASGDDSTGYQPLAFRDILRSGRPR